MGRDFTPRVDNCSQFSLLGYREVVEVVEFIPGTRGLVSSLSPRLEQVCGLFVARNEED